jgi:hypothetical protein
MYFIDAFQDLLSEMFKLRAHLLYLLAMCRQWLSWRSSSFLYFQHVDETVILCLNLTDDLRFIPQRSNEID